MTQARSDGVVKPEEMRKEWKRVREEGVEEVKMAARVEGREEEEEEEEEGSGGTRTSACWTGETVWEADSALWWSEGEMEVEDGRRGAAVLATGEEEVLFLLFFGDGFSSSVSSSIGCECSIFASERCQPSRSFDPLNDAPHVSTFPPSFFPLRAQTRRKDDWKEPRVTSSRGKERCWA
jgi:hypothetical protein